MKRVQRRFSYSMPLFLRRLCSSPRDLASNDTLKDPAGSVLLSVLGLMPTKDFIRSSAQLMQTGSDQTRQQVFRSLENRVSHARKGDSASQKIFIDVLPNCGVFIREDQPIATRHAAISCIDQISEKYGKTDRATVLDVARQVAGSAALGSADQSLKTISILCLASMTEVLGDECIPIWPNVILQTLQHLEEDVSSGNCNDELQNAGLSLLISVLDEIPWMLSEQTLDRSIVLADQISCYGEEAGSAQDLCILAAKKVAVPQLLEAIERTWTKMLELGEDAMLSHLGILHRAIEHNTKSNITANSRLLFDILLGVFDLRRHFHQDGDRENHSDLFDLVDKTALDTTLKLSDATFRPFFTRLVEWATTSLPKKDEDGRVLRTMSLYSFSLTLFDQLKSIVTGYASLLLDSASQCLRNSTTTGPLDQDLLNLVLRTLSSSFRHDQDDFWQSPAHFDPIADPLIEQLKKAKTLKVTDQVIPTITDLAAAAASPEHYKTMNTTIMSYMRDDDAALRIAAVKCERSITERVNIDWLALLPEMLPFISELQEDDDEDVERETLRWVKQIEDVTGESLEGMLA